jgi:hypothetical protein
MIQEAMDFENPESRLWLKVGDAVPYDGEPVSEGSHSSAEVYFMQGTPIRGWIIAWRDRVVRLNSNGNRIGRFAARTFQKRRMARTSEVT